MIRVRFSAIFGAALIGLGLASSGGCSGSGDPVMTEAAKEAERKNMEELTKANDAAAKTASRPQSKVGVMPP